MKICRMKIGPLPWQTTLARLWQSLREVTGDAAYESYVRSRRRCCNAAGTTDAKQQLLSRQEFYLDMLRRRYSGVSRCC
ncbi:MAG: CstA-like transporter-associated (seleno)protein [Candidatus Acidiferrales bacterium]